ncbi:MAG: ribosome maturation factor RimM [Chloroflexi bacterium]|nr:ribosome maturation factor RimM [Chloroflexota bacterium]
MQALLLTDFPERITEGLEVFINCPDPRKSPVKTRIRSSRSFKKGILVSLEGVDDRDAAEELRGASLEIPEGDVRQLPEGNFYIYQLIGLEVKSIQGEFLGVLEEVLQSPANDVYVVRDGKSEVLVPALRKIVKEVDLESGTMLVDRDGSW